MKARAKRCAKCGKPYYRRNKTELWTGRNPGHRDGWVKTESKLCLACLSPEQVTRMLLVADLRIGEPAKARVRAARPRERARERERGMHVA